MCEYVIGVDVLGCDFFFDLYGVLLGDEVVDGCVELCD